MARDGKTPKHDYIERSERRGGYRPRAAERRKTTAWDVIRLILSCLLCVVCFPLGLFALWTCRFGAGTRMLLTIVTGVLFFALSAFALTVETDIPMIDRLQDRAVEGLSKVEQRVQVELYKGQQIAEALPPVLIQRVLVPAAEWIENDLPGMQQTLASIGGQGTALIETTQAAAALSRGEYDPVRNVGYREIEQLNIHRPHAVQVELQGVVVHHGQLSIAAMRSVSGRTCS